MKTGYFIAPGQKKRINPVLLAATVLALAGCSHSSEPQFSLAPPPPAFDQNAPQNYGPPNHLMAFNGAAIPFPSHISLTDYGMPGQDASFNTGNRAALKAEGEGKKCRLKDRFDRGSQVLAYQWGRNRVGLDVDGLNMDDREFEGFKVEYRLRLQDYKPKKERCWYDSHWQGLIGSGYNEMFLRKENTIWNQLDEMVDEAEDAVDKLF